MGLTSLRDLLSCFTFNRPGLRRSINASMIVQAANRIIPSYLSRMRPDDVVAMSFKAKTLRLQARNAAVGHGIRAIERSLLNRMREEFPAAQIDRIQVVISQKKDYEFS